MLANWDMTQLARYGMPGVWTHALRRRLVSRLRAPKWPPTTMRLMRFYEIFGNAGATTMQRTIYQSNPAITGGGGGFGDFTKRQWYRPNPPYRAVLWSMRDNTNYAETGALSSLQFVAGFPN